MRVMGLLGGGLRICRVLKTMCIPASRMSTYASYNDISKSYDANRSAVCSHLYVGALQTKIETPLKDQHVLDAGCGTGNYACALLNAGVGRMTLLDASDGMLEKAKKKCEKFVAESRASFVHHALPTLPFEDNMFNCVMMNLVIHHLDTDGKRPNFLKFVSEANRIVKPGGMLALGVIFPNQFQKGNWQWQLAPRMLTRFNKIIPTQEEMMFILNDAGFTEPEIVVPTTALLIPSALYFDQDGPLRDEIRQATTYYDRMTPPELELMFNEIRKMQKEGTMAEYIRDHDKQRLHIGQFSFVLAKKANTYHE